MRPYYILPLISVILILMSVSRDAFSFGQIMYMVTAMALIVMSAISLIKEVRHNSDKRI